ncbi:MAG: hypothetical protein ACD_75C01548G0002 [uncultured bacterium]|nr:MAG: hypothetical protein ACD_75C01548G0002 [uncultured bacterium]
MGIRPDQGEELLPPEQPTLLDRHVGEVPGGHHGNHVGIGGTGGHLPFAVGKACDFEHLSDHVPFHEGRNRGRFVGAGRSVGDGRDHLADDGRQVGPHPHPVDEHGVVGLDRVGKIFVDPVEDLLPVARLFRPLQVEDGAQFFRVAIVEKLVVSLRKIIVVDFLAESLEYLVFVHNWRPVEFVFFRCNTQPPVNSVCKYSQEKIWTTTM